MVLRLIFSSFILFAFFACHPRLASSNLSNASAEIVQSMEGDAFIGTKSIGRTMDISPEFTRRHALMTAASTKELKILVQHENPVIGLSAFEGLVNRKHPNITEFLDYFAENKVMVHYLKGDLSSHVSTLEYAYTVILELSLNWEENSKSGFYQFDHAAQIKYATQIQAFQMAQ